MPEHLPKHDITLANYIEVFIPTELVELGVHIDLKRFFDAMIYKLRRNAAKGRWEGLNLEHTMNLGQREHDELAKAIEEGSDIEIVLEAADVANFALISASLAIEGRGGKRKPIIEKGEQTPAERIQAVAEALRRETRPA